MWVDGFYYDHMKGFKAKKVTFSDEALKIAEEFRKTGSFRSLSQTLEELIRRMQYIDGLTAELANIQLARLGIKLKVE